MKENRPFLFRALLVLVVTTIPLTPIVYGVNGTILGSATDFEIDLAAVAQTGLPLLVLGTLLGLPVLGVLSRNRSRIAPAIFASYALFTVIWFVIRGGRLDTAWMIALPLIGLGHGLLFWLVWDNKYVHAALRHLVRIKPETSSAG